MSTTTAPHYACPRCQSVFAAPSRYCGQCGANMGGDDPSWSGGDRRLSASNQAWLGRIVDGRYRVIEAIGRGGMGVVYKVEHLRMGKIAAMKVLHAELAGDPDVVRRFEREAAAVSRLNHPNTVQVFDFGAAAGNLYLIMELVRGQDLARIIDRDGPLRWGRAAPLLVQVCGALSEAHELGIIHRDLKPENVLVSRGSGGRDFAKVLDFGLAKLGRDPAPTQVTDRTEIVGTPYYMSPEQIRGDEVDARSDVYSLGAVIYKILTGDAPFAAKTAVGVLTKHLTAALEPPSTRRAGIDPRIDELVIRAMAKEPAARFPSAQAMSEAIEAIVDDVAHESTPVQSSRSLGRRLVSTSSDDSELHLRRSDIDAYELSLRRQRWLSMAIAVVVAAAAAAAALWWFVLRAAPLQTTEHEPNNRPGEASWIPAGREITAFIGQRLSRSEADRDFYRIRGGGDRVLTARTTAPPNVDVELTIRDANGAVIAAANETGIGGAERIHRRRTSGSVSIEVSGVNPQDQGFPIENVSDPYTLVVAVEPLDPAWEVEPNNTATDATNTDRSVSGWLDSHDDVDLIRWAGGAGSTEVEVSAAPELPLAWAGPDGVTRGPGRIRLELRAGDIFRIARTDRSRRDALSGGDTPWTIRFAAK